MTVLNDFSSYTVWNTERALRDAKAYPFDGTLDEAEARHTLLDAHASVIHNYIPDGPGWCGSIVTLVWGECLYVTLVGFNDDSTWVRQMPEPGVGLAA